jgi:hypothetical protein
MLIIIDARLPENAITKLKKLGEVFLLKSDNIVYESISGHPDIFITQIDELVVMAPNAPIALKEALKKNRIPFLKGKAKLSKRFPDTVYYNAVCTADFLIHKEGHTDACILHETTKKKYINVSQAYTRCNLMKLPDDSFITSDKGIEKSLKAQGIEVYYLYSDDVELSGQDHGFIGGTMGVLENKLYIIGSLSYYQQATALKDICSSKGLEIVELYDGPLIDGGGIFFLK